MGAALPCRTELTSLSERARPHRTTYFYGHGFKVIPLSCCGSSCHYIPHWSKWTVSALDNFTDTPLGERFRESRRCSRETYPESHITEYAQYTKITSASTESAACRTRRLIVWKRRFYPKLSGYVSGYVLHSMLVACNMKEFV